MSDRVKATVSSAMLLPVFVLLFVLSAFLPGPLFAQDAELLARVDALIEEEKPRDALALMERFSGNAEIYWRRAQATLIIGDQRKDAGAPDSELLEIFARGEAFADQAIAADPRKPEGYYWKSANIGRWGQTRGVLNSLFRASDMRGLLEQAIALDPSHGDSFFVLAQLYAKVPGVVSFGNNAYAVSLGWKAVHLMEAEVASGERDKPIEAYYVELGSHLIDRGWNERRRGRSMGGITSSYRSASTPLEQGYFYEGSLNRPNRSDQEEAREVLQGTIRRLQAIRNPLPSETRRLQQAQELLAGI